MAGDWIEAMLKPKTLAAGAAIFGIMLGVAAFALGTPAIVQIMGGYDMGPGVMFGGGAANQPVYRGWDSGVLDYRQVEGYLRDRDQQGRVDRARNTITYSGNDITINMAAEEPGHRDQTFEVSHLTNPTLVVPLGATIHLNLVNMDYENNMEHGIITPAPPPFPFMTMIVTGPGLAGVMPLLPWRTHKPVEKARYETIGATFAVQEPGTYWYICPTPEHAEKGMYDASGRRPRHRGTR